MLTQKREVNQPNNSKLTLQVMNDLTVQLYTNPQFDFLMDTETVAKGYGVSAGTIRSHKLIHQDEIVENTHFISSVENINAGNLKKKQVFWTKAGVIRLGFFIKSERAKLFRDWAENIVLEVTAPKVNLPAPTKRKHNRITPARMVEILADVAKIDDKELRLSLISKLGV